MATIELTGDTFNETIEHSDIVLLDFWASWCGPCRSFAPIYESASNKHEDVVFGKVNTEEQQSLAAAFRIRSIPTLMIFKEGLPVFAQPGLLPEAALDDLIEQVRGLDMDELRARMDEQAA